MLFSLSPAMPSRVKWISKSWAPWEGLGGVWEDYLTKNISMNFHRRHFSLFSCSFLDIYKYKSSYFDILKIIFLYLGFWDLGCEFNREGQRTISNVLIYTLMADFLYQPEITATLPSPPSKPWNPPTALGKGSSFNLS